MLVLLLSPFNFACFQTLGAYFSAGNGTVVAQHTKSMNVGQKHPFCHIVRMTYLIA
jgi:hypothetical protein